MSVMLPHQFKVLCIEDEADIRYDIVEELRDHGFQVEQAATAEDALPLIEALQPNIIVCDMQMPGMNGIELLENLRQRDDGLAAIPFVFLTAFGDREAMIGGRRAGADDYLVKPVDYDLLIASIESHLLNTARRAEISAEANLMSTGIATLPGRGLLLDHLRSCPVEALFAIVNIDNPGELAHRFGHRERNSASRLAHRFASVAGVGIFWLNAHTCAMTCDNPDRLEAVLARLVDLRLRDRASGNFDNARIPFSIVTARRSVAEDDGALIDRMVQAARLVQLEGGARVVDVEGPELRELKLASDIRSELVSAIRQGQLHVCYQPKVSCRSGLITGAEVLVRWESPLLGQLSPDTFIPVVERAGLLPHVTDWVLDQAVRGQKTLLADDLPARLAINIGASEFTEDLPQRIGKILDAAGADPRLIEIEITETSLMNDPDGANAIIKALHDTGMKVALDDFGTGFSTLSFLRSCAVDAIKIDRSFVERVSDKDSDQKIVQGIVKLAQLLGLDTIAEGVETDRQREWLASNGCDLIQGFLISRPLRLDAYLALLRAHGSTAKY